MASLYTDLATTTATSTGIPERISDARLSSGKRVHFHAVYTSTGSEAADDELFVLKLRKGMLLLPDSLKITAESGLLTANTGYATLNIGEVDYTDGTSDDATKYAAAVPVLDGGTQFVCPEGKFWTVHQEERPMGGGNAAETESIAAVAAADVVFANITNAGGNADCYLLSAVAAAGSIAFTFNEDPGGGGLTVATEVKRAATYQAEAYVPVATPGECWLAATIASEANMAASKKLVISGDILVY
jgi:hypothetical protein